MYDSKLFCRSHTSRSSGEHLTVADLADFLRDIEGVDYGMLEFGEILDMKRHRQVNPSLSTCRMTGN